MSAIAIPLWRRAVRPAWQGFARLVERAQAARSNHAYAPMIRLAAEFIRTNRVAGDYLEFGCCRARSFAAAWREARRFALPWHLYVFDSFAGLPTPRGVDGGGAFAAGQFAMDLPAFERVARALGVPHDRYTAVPGFYHDSLTEGLRARLPLRRAAFVFIDCDLYESARDALGWVAPYLQTGTVLAFDDYFCFAGDASRGEQRALAEFLAARPEFTLIDWHLFGWHGKSFIVNRRAGATGGDA